MYVYIHVKFEHRLSTQLARKKKKKTFFPKVWLSRFFLEE
jgi:hypothetical protein